MRLSLQFLAGSFLCATLGGTAPTPIPGTVNDVVEWAKENNVDIPNAGAASEAESTDAIVEWGKANNIEITTEGITVATVPGSADALMEWATTHNVKVPTVGAAFEGTADYDVY
ncbi:hypothetical protein F5Y10DRAFT_231361 [Nemania abortiva]|nr:hypothetical protein F5Y10DRAFT_231361 [Nemania abortiva]